MFLITAIFTAFAIREVATTIELADTKIERSKNVSKKMDEHQTYPSSLNILQDNGLWSVEAHSKQPMMWHSQTNSIINPKVQFQVPAPGIIESTPANGHRRCPMSPFAKFLTDGEQEALHELIVEARQNGADEPQIKEHINKYLKEILTAEKLEQFEEANAKFEKERFSKHLRPYSDWKSQTENGPSIKEGLQRQKSDTDNGQPLSKLIFRKLNF